MKDVKKSIPTVQMFLISSVKYVFIEIIHYIELVRCIKIICYTEIARAVSHQFRSTGFLSPFLVLVRYLGNWIRYISPPHHKSVLRL